MCLERAHVSSRIAVCCSELDWLPVLSIESFFGGVYCKCTCEPVECNFVLVHFLLVICAVRLLNRWFFPFLIKSKNRVYFQNLQQITSRKQSEITKDFEMAEHCEWCVSLDVSKRNLKFASFLIAKTPQIYTSIYQAVQPHLIWHRVFSLKIIFVGTCAG